jgi:hypothetical protein
VEGFDIFEIVEHIVINERAHCEMYLHTCTRAFLLLRQIKDVTKFNFSIRRIKVAIDV